MTTTRSFESHDVSETMEIAAELAASLPGGSVIHLVGDLGVGKTHFAKGLAEGLGLSPDDVCSPTFTIVNVHRPAVTDDDEPRLGLVHVDLYRIDGPEELTELGLDELPGSDAIAAVEWPERLAGHEAGAACRVTLSELGPDDRRIVIERPDTPTPPARILR
ncbi:MAG: tRNA (adenosine(37)-N6)-threonylcarbamoyltransferase complex ATPase subunit type 1 TsaE [Acidobacteriota bacterium]